MNESGTALDEQKVAPARRDIAHFVNVFAESAVQALAKTVLFFIFGSITLGVAGHIWREMAPSRPPGFTPELEVEPGALPARGFSGFSLQEHWVPLIFVCIFVPTLWGRLSEPKPSGSTGVAAWMRKTANQLSRNWFDLFVGNAFGALATAFAIGFASHFEFSRMALGWVLPQLRGVIDLVLGEATGFVLETWVRWYGANELKFTFWFFYLAAVCDDLGIPNFKSLWHWTRNRLRRPRHDTQTELETSR